MIIRFFFYNEKKNRFLLLNNGATVSCEIENLIMTALRSLLKRDYEEYQLLVEFCRTKHLPNYLNKLKKMLDIEHASVNQNDIINVVCSAVDQDMVIGSPSPHTPRMMYT